MKKALTVFIGKYFVEDPDFRVQIFNTLGFLGFTLSIIFGVFSLIVNPVPLYVISNFGASFVAVIVILLANKTRRFKLFFLITVIVVFLLIFPFLFFIGGGIASGMPSFFVFAVVFTVIMLEGRRRAFFTILELALYAGCFLIAYYFPMTVIPFQTEADMMQDIIVACIASSAVLAIAIYRHITTYDRKQKELEQANAELHRLDRLKTEFFQNMNHDMKTPLTVIESYINNADDMLDHDVAKEQVRECLAHAQSQIEDLARMVEYSLSLAAAQEAGRNMEQIDFSALLLSGEGMFGAALKKSGNTFSIQTPDRLPKIKGNADMLRQVMGNLLFNAAKHTKDGEITVSLTCDGEKLITSVTDTGEGIDPGLLPRVFDRGVSGSGTTGFGLSICKAIVEIHGGEIRIESEPGKGTAVFFTLPIEEKD